MRDKTNLLKFQGIIKMSKVKLCKSMTVTNNSVKYETVATWNLRDK